MDLQGVIVAAPVYAATASRWKAMGIALASVRSYFHLKFWLVNLVSEGHALITAEDDGVDRHLFT